MQSLLLLKAFMMFGLALWLTIACLNNIIDPSTNRYLIRHMFNMTLIKEDSVIGQGLLSRASNNEHNSSIILKLIIISQAFIALSLWFGAIEFLMNQMGFIGFSVQNATSISNYALLFFLSLWLCFLCGGLWFGYWIKMWQTQIIHLLLLIISFLAIIIVNLPEVVITH